MWSQSLYNGIDREKYSPLKMNPDPACINYIRSVSRDCTCFTINMTEYISAQKK